MADQLGSVYVFNLYPEDVAKFIVNGQRSAGTIASWGRTAPYTPHNLPVSRSAVTNIDLLSGPAFIQGANTITVDYLGISWTGTVNIPTTAPPLVFDLWLYITNPTNVANPTGWLFDTQGTTYVPVYSNQTTMTMGGKKLILRRPPWTF